jgi:hypothetical protein
LTGGTFADFARENIAEVLKQRARELPAPIQMCDALSRNTPKLEGVLFQAQLTPRRMD